MSTPLGACLTGSIIIIIIMVEEQGVLLWCNAICIIIINILPSHLDFSEH